MKAIFDFRSCYVKVYIWDPRTLFCDAKITYLLTYLGRSSKTTWSSGRGGVSERLNDDVPGRV